MLGCYHPPMQAQSYVKRNAFTTNEGLPSNHIYDIIEDSKGFLWVATDNGVSRFDGKYFQNFSVKNGLPSNEVLQILKDGDGNIWANSYKQPPAYFDEIMGCFVTIKSHRYLNIISKTLLVHTYLENGGIKFYNQLGYVVIKNKKITAYSKGPNISSGVTIGDKDLYFKFKKSSAKPSIDNSDRLYLKNRLLDSMVLESKFDLDRLYANRNEIFQFTKKNRVYKISKINVDALSYQLDTLVIPADVVWFKFTDQNMILTSSKGDVYAYNRNSLAFIAKVENNINANCAYIDKFKNIWVGTLDAGLTFYSNHQIRNVKISDDYIKPNFLSIALSDKGEVLAGNYYGQILSIRHDQVRKFQLYDNKSPGWIRKILSIKDKTILVKDNGYSVNFKPGIKVFTAKKKVNSLKTAIVINDSLIVLGTIAGLVELNLVNGKTRSLNSEYDRALSLVKANHDQIYYLGPKGLYKYSLSVNVSSFIPLNKASQNENLSALTFAKDSTLWAGSFIGNLIVFKNDKVIATIKNNVSLPENITCMLAHKNRIWIGSKKGITALEYKIAGNKLSYTIDNISKIDGLPSNTINGLAIKNDTVYVATEKGISMVPVNYQNPKFEISPELTDVKINQANTPIAKSYILESNQNNITLQFAGIELSGHFKTIQYALNDNKNWSSLDGNNLNVQLNSGNHSILIRAVDINNQISKQTLRLNFVIKTPFYKALWFWVAMAILTTASIFWWINRMKLQKQNDVFEQKLAMEMQRKKITADLHDDIGATLSSLQLNSAVANQLINTDIRQAKKILGKIEDQSKNLADKIGDIIWSMKPGKDEFMTIESRIKNFANDILGVTNINYKIWIDPIVNQTIRDISARKNIVLITKEAINNVVKYSSAAEVLISLKIKDNRIQLIIQDNGNGFNVGEKKGNGLANMRKRTEELNGTFTISSGLRNGTSILVEIPLVP